ncbi:nitric oxide synthase-interacting protein-like [Stylophora pistillata]|uniref:Nitric oxide synthase-interacting protein n=1 Tax=Stylophora pistillata TaxID=50429 RepID=A0A2B4RNI7_STYPI|nr:nitric oxide synthase-interacting protein-like [Stylophora pistillata]PFX17835.1 Nitric oxide synthase-interacting protein [Stylophora pistillata]
MTRHAKNCTAGTVYTYHERKKDTKKSGYGSKSVRLGRDSVKNFDCCCLTLQPCREPVVTPDGFLYDREAILECLLHQKTEAARKMKAFEKQKKKQDAEEAGKVEEKERSKVESFVNMEKRLTTKPTSAFTATKDRSINGSSDFNDEQQPSTSSGGSSGNDKNLQSFWVPSLTPEAKPTLLKKPDSKTYCPMSGKPLRIKDLIAVKLTPIDDGDDRPMVAKSERYKCAVTHDALGNSVPCAVLKNTGNVVTMDCIEKLIKKDMLCPFTGSKLKESDIIPLQRGGTGFAGAGTQLEAKRAGPVLQA